VNTVRTVSDTKRAFYTLHTRPISSVYRRVVEELMVEIHLLNVNENFRYDPIFALGVVSTFDRFMEGYEPVLDRDSIFSALCRAEEMSPDQFRADAQSALSAVQGRSAEDAIAWITQSASTGGAGLAATLQDIAHNTKFKYSRLFAIGLYTLLETVDSALVAEEPKLHEIIDKLSAPLNLAAGKIQKDLELYRSNLDKLQQARKAIAEFIEGERRRQEKRAEEQAAAAAAASAETSAEKPESSPEVSP
jgi:photosystem II biogenesis protein Psp29